MYDDDDLILFSLATVFSVGARNLFAELRHEYLLVTGEVCEPMAPAATFSGCVQISGNGTITHKNHKT